MWWTYTQTRHTLQHIHTTHKHVGEDGKGVGVVSRQWVMMFVVVVVGLMVLNRPVVCNLGIQTGPLAATIPVGLFQAGAARCCWYSVTSRVASH